MGLKVQHVPHFLAEIDLRLLAGRFWRHLFRRKKVATNELENLWPHKQMALLLLIQCAGEYALTFWCRSAIFESNTGHGEQEEIVL